MDDSGQQPRVLPIDEASRNPDDGPLVLPPDFTDLERGIVFGGGTAAYNAGRVYMRELGSVSGSGRIPLANAAETCYLKAADLKTSDALRLDVAYALLQSFEDRAGRVPDTGRLSLTALNNAIDGSLATEEEEPTSVPFAALAWQVLVRYVVTGRKDHFEQAIDMWTRRVEALKCLDDDPSQRVQLSHARIQLMTTYLQKCTRHERDDVTAKKALDLAQEEAAGYGQGEPPSFEASVLLAIAYEQSFILHGNDEDMSMAIQTIEPLTNRKDLDGDERTRAQYEFGRLNAVRGMATRDREALHEGIYNVQRATEDTPKGSPLWMRRDDVFHDYLEAFAPIEDWKGDNAEIRAVRAHLGAAEAMGRASELPSILEQLADLYARRYSRRHTLDDLHDEKACRERAANAGGNSTLLERFKRAGYQVTSCIGLFWDDDDDPVYVETALREGRLAMELFEQLTREEILTLLHPTIVGAIFQSTATAFRLKYDGDGGAGDGGKRDEGPDVGNKELLVTAIGVLERGVTFLDACIEEANTEAAKAGVVEFAAALRKDIERERKEVERVEAVESRAQRVSST